MHDLKKKVRNKACVEGSIAEAYLIEEIATFCSLYFESSVETRLNRVPRNDDGGSVGIEGRLSIFTSSGRAFGRRDGRWLDSVEYNAAVIYALLNCNEITPYIDLYDDAIRSLYPGIGDEQLEKRRTAEFAEWLKVFASISSNNVDVRIKEMVAGPARRVQCYAGYYVNGFKFHTFEYGQNKKTMNSGVRIKGSCYDEYERDFYGMLVDVVELTYFGLNNRVVLFKCVWYDSERGVRVHPRHGILDIKHSSRLHSDEPFVLASQANQVYYMAYPCRSKELSAWWAVCNIKARNTFNVSELEDESENESSVGDILFLEDEMVRPINILEESNDNDQAELSRDSFEEVDVTELPRMSSHHVLQEDDMDEEESNEDEDEDEDETEDNDEEDDEDDDDDDGVDDEDDDDA